MHDFSMFYVLLLSSEHVQGGGQLHPDPHFHQQLLQHQQQVLDLFLNLQHFTILIEIYEYVYHPHKQHTKFQSLVPVWLTLYYESAHAHCLFPVWP